MSASEIALLLSGGAAIVCAVILGAYWFIDAIKYAKKRSEEEDGDNW